MPIHPAPVDSESAAAPSSRGHVHLRFERPWSDGTTSVSLEPLALIARLAAIVPEAYAYCTS